MKPTIKEIRHLTAELERVRTEKSLSNAEVGRLSGVHPSQVGRIFDGSFRTYSFNVVQVCSALGVQIPGGTMLEPSVDPSWAKIEKSIRRLWDTTPAGAKSLARLLEAIAEVRSSEK